MNLIFGYKVLDNRRCGFPKSVFEKVIDTLNNYKISYQIIYSDSEPIIKDFKKLNKYQYFYNQALKLMTHQNRIELIINKIKNSDEKDFEEIVKAIENVQSK